MTNISRSIEAFANAGMPGRLNSGAAWAGIHVGDIVLTSAGAADHRIAAYIPKHTSDDLQAIGGMIDGVREPSLPSDAAAVARRRVDTMRTAQAAVKDAETGVWHVSSLVDDADRPIRFDALAGLEELRTTARFEPSEQGRIVVGSVHGEQVEFPVDGDMLEAFITHPKPQVPGLPAVHTRAGQLALDAADRGTVSHLAGVQDLAAHRASEAAADIREVAQLDGLRAIPAALRDTPVIQRSDYMTTGRAYETYIDADSALHLRGDEGRAFRAARRMSMGADGQLIGGFQIGPADNWLIAPLLERSGQPPTKLARAFAGMVHTAAGPVPWGELQPQIVAPGQSSSLAPELKFLAHPAGIDDPRHGRVVSLPEPAAVAAQILGLPVHAAIEQVEQRAASVAEQLEHSSWLRARSLNRTAADLEVQLNALRDERDQATRKIVDEASPGMLSEPEEWTSRGSAYNLRDIARVPRGEQYEQVVNAEVAASSASSTSGRVVLQDVQGMLHTAAVDVSPADLLEIASYNVRFSQSLMAMTVGGRTVAWNASGYAVLK